MRHLKVSKRGWPPDAVLGEKTWLSFTFIHILVMASRKYQLYLWLLSQLHDNFDIRIRRFNYYRACSLE